MDRTWARFRWTALAVAAGLVLVALPQAAAATMPPDGPDLYVDKDPAEIEQTLPWIDPDVAVDAGATDAVQTTRPDPVPSTGLQVMILEVWMPLAPPWTCPSVEGATFQVTFWGGLAQMVRPCPTPL